MSMSVAELNEAHGIGKKKRCQQTKCLNGVTMKVGDYVMVTYIGYPGRHHARVIKVNAKSFHIYGTEDKTDSMDVTPIKINTEGELWVFATADETEEAHAEFGKPPHPPVGWDPVATEPDDLEGVVMDEYDFL